MLKDYLNEHIGKYDDSARIDAINKIGNIRRLNNGIGNLSHKDLATYLVSNIILNFYPEESENGNK